MKINLGKSIISKIDNRPNYFIHLASNLYNQLSNQIITPLHSKLAFQFQNGLRDQLHTQINNQLKNAL